MDSFKEYPVTPNSPIRDAAGVTPDDAIDLAEVTRALYVGVAGDIALITAGGQSVVFQAVPAGSLLPLRTSRILATGTTAGGIMALW